MTVYNRRKHRNNHQRGKAILKALSLGPRVVPNLVGANPIEIVAVEPWMQHAACLDVDPELFYPEKGGRSSTRAAKRICSHCLVKADCLQYAVSHHEPFGIWGGQTPTERRRRCRVVTS